MSKPDPGSVPSAPGSRASFRRYTLVIFGLFVLLSLAFHFVMGPTLTSLSPLWRTPDVAETGVSIITLSRAKLAIERPTPSPPPKIYLRTIANIAPMKYLEIGLRGKRHAIKPPARRTSMLSVHLIEPTSAPGPDAAAVTDVVPATKPKAGDSAQADSGADKSHVAGAVVWGDDNPPRVLALASLDSSANPTPSAHRVRLEIEVGPDGDVLSVKVIASSGDPALDAAAIDAARKSTYAPATLNGLPVHGTCIVDFPGTPAGTT